MNAIQTIASQKTALIILASSLNGSQLIRLEWPSNDQMQIADADI